MSYRTKKLAIDILRQTGGWTDGPTHRDAGIDNSPALKVAWGMKGNVSVRPLQQRTIHCYIWTDSGNWILMDDTKRCDFLADKQTFTLTYIMVYKTNGI